MRISRRFTRAGASPYADIEFRKTSSEIRKPDGSVVFAQDGVDVPADWSQVACDVLAQKYFRKAGVPARLKSVEENTVPSFLWRHVPDEAALAGLEPVQRVVGETSATQVFDRLAGTWAYWGWKGGYFDGEEDAQAYYDEMRFMLARQIGAPNSPQWFNTGLHWAYGIDGPAQGHYYVDHQTGELCRSDSAYEHPQPHACFIQSVADDLVNEGGIMDLWVREARIFKYGSGSGSNFSKLRGDGERLSGGGRSSGLMSFLRIGDRAAGAIKSGGTTRRAAKMVILNLDHPDILNFIRWKVVEEQKVAALVSGSRMTKRRLQAVLAAVRTPAGIETDPRQNPALRSAVREARAALVPEGYIQRVLLLAAQGVRDIHFPEYDTDWDSEAYYTVSGQNSNNSVRVPNAFFDVLARRGQWELKRRTDGKSAGAVPAEQLWDEIAHAAWACADPGVQYDTTINEWHTCPEDGRINASNPCVTGETLVATAEGWQRIDALVGKTARVIGSDGEPHLVTRIFPTGHKPVFDLRTRLGYQVRITGDHKVLTVGRGDVAVADLTVGNRLILRGAGFGRRSLATDLALGVGVAVADGYLTQSVVRGHAQESLVLTTDAGESPVLAVVADAVHAGRAALQAVGGLGRQAGSGVITRTAATARLMLSEAAAVAVFREFAILDEGAASIRFAPAIFELDRPALAAVLRGLFTADATVANYGEQSRYISLDSTSLELLRQAQMLLLAFGIKARLYEDTRLAEATPARPHPTHSLRISRASCPLFEQAIGFHAESPKAEALARLNGNEPATGEELTDEVVAIEPAGEADVFDLTETVTHHFVAGGIVVHNCSEYLFLDDTACNLASINLVKFLREDGGFDVDGFRHACRLWTSVLEISVLMAAYPSPAIAQRSWDFRTLGLGYANMGTVLMRRGIPYDSPEATAICGAVTAIMCGEAYATSAEMARDLGPFPGYHKNQTFML